jgi:hypothetical protein
VKFSSVVSIQIFSVKNVNPSFYAKYIENGYFLLPSKFEMWLREARQKDSSRQSPVPFM